MGLDWLITGVAISGKVLAVKKHRGTWLLSMVNQIPWLYICIDKELYGLIPLTVVHFGLAIWGYQKWSK